MVALCDDLQREYLDQLLAQHPEEKQFASDLELIRKRVVEVPARETAADKQLRLQAEHRVLLFVREKGERIGHGDLLPNSVKMAKFFSEHSPEVLFISGLLRRRTPSFCHHSPSRKLTSLFPNSNL